MGYYLKDTILKKIFKTIREYFASKSFNKDAEQHVLNVTDLDPASSSHTPHNYTFVIEKDEAFYAKNIEKLYSVIVENFLVKHNQTITRHSSNLNRFVYLAGSATSFALGKTVHNTYKTLQMEIHFPLETQVNHVAYDRGHNAHFRVNYFFSQGPMSIRDLVFDLNYIYCYHRNIFKNLSGIDYLS